MPWFTLSELRATDQKALAADRVPDEQLQAAVDDAVSAFEDATHVAWSPTTAETTAIGDGTTWLILPRNAIRSVRDVTINGEDVAPSTVSVAGNRMLRRMAGWPAGATITVAYTHGVDAPPRRVRRAVMILARLWATRGPITERATQQTNDLGTINLATPGLLGSRFGIPEVDEVARDYAWDDPVRVDQIDVS